jgi:glycosyltransferase 2 family protein
MTKKYRWVNYGLCAAVLGYVGWHLRLDTLSEKVAGLDWPLLLVAVGLGVVSVGLQALRWQYLLRPTRVRYRTVIQAAYLGTLVNEILPFRPGEVVRGILVSHRSGRGIAAVLSTEVVERLSDALAMGTLILLAVRGLDLPAGLKVAQLVLVGGLSLLVLAAFMVALRERTLRHRLAAWAPQRRSAVTARRVGLDLTAGLRLLRNWRAMSVSISVAVAIAGIQVMVFWLALRAYRLDMTLFQAAAVLAVVSIGTLLPNAPGNLGSWQFFCMLGLSLFGIDKSTAAGFAVVVFAVLSLALILGGLVALLTSPFRLSQLRGMHHATPQPALVEAHSDPEH